MTLVLSGTAVSSNFGEHFWFSNISISIQSYQHSEVLYLSLERLKLTLHLSLLVSVRDLSGTFAHEKVGDSQSPPKQSPYLLRVRSNVEILNTTARTTTTSASCLAVPAWSYTISSLLTSAPPSPEVTVRPRPRSLVIS